MKVALPSGVEAECSRIVDALIEGELSTLRDCGWSGRCDPRDLERVLAEYGRTFVALPPDAFDHADTCKVEGERKWLIDLPLWTKEEGRSDMTLQLSVTAGADGAIVEIDDLRVP